MCKQKVPEEYVLFVRQMLANRHTHLKFNNFLLDWISIDNGIGQGDPLSMILYLYYNANPIDVVSSRSQAAITFIDNANLYAEGAIYEAAYYNLCNMLLKLSGAQEWTQTHSSRFKNPGLLSSASCTSMWQTPSAQQVHS